ncbi:DUF86 domain-containing protein [Candidatus Pacearchaeota archaeon]|nr:DUF86 domain-containing protein [Candidatus Pacearchaeota archaeon]
MKRNLILFVEDILENIELLEKSTGNISKEELEDNLDIRDATVRRLEVIGEAVKNIPNSFREKYPLVPWKKVAGLRDIIIHAYFGLDLDVIWSIVKNDIFPLKKQIEEILEKERIVD